MIDIQLYELLRMEFRVHPELIISLHDTAKIAMARFLALVRVDQVSKHTEAWEANA